MFLTSEDHLIVFSGDEKPFDAKQWLKDTTELLKAAMISHENQVEMVKIQLNDVARTWWLAEKAGLERAISWDQFSKSFMRDSSLHPPRKRWKSSSSDYNNGIGPLMNMLQNS